MERCVVYLESVGDHPRSNVSGTSLAKFSEHIMLRRCRQRLGGQIQRISYAYAWILGRWFLTRWRSKIHTLYIKSAPGSYLVEHNSLCLEFVRRSGGWEHAECVKRGRTKSILCVANNPEVGLQDFLCTHCYHGGQRGEAYLLKNLSESSSFQRQWRYDIFKHEFIISIWLSEKGLDTFL